MSTVLKTKRQRIAWMLIVVVVSNIFAPATSYALTSGPTQPEVQSFQPAGTTDMVDLFSGDFSYNIPLFELPGPNGGYPFNLSYQAGITMEQEASWVGLGWSLNPGAINRQMRGLPDDFNGDEITTKMSIKPAITAGVGGGGGFEIFGGSDKRDIGNLGLSIFYNNYKGFGYSVDASAGFSPSVRSGMTSAMHIGASLTLNSQEGATASPSLSLGSKMGLFGVSAGYNSQRGLQDISFTHSKELRYTPDSKSAHKPSETWKANSSAYASLGLAHPGYVPQVSMPMLNFSVSARISGGGAWWGAFGKTYIKGFYTEQKLRNDKVSVKSKSYGYLNYDAGMSDPESVLDFNREKDGMVSQRTPNLAIPSMTYDIYSVAGQGISAMYRPVRNDIGILRDPKVTSESTGTGVGVDGAANLAHVGVNLTINHSNSTSGAWKDDNDVDDLMSFQSKPSNDTYEPWNFKVHGELTSEKVSILNGIGGTDAVRLELGQRGEEIYASTDLKGRSGPGGELNETTIDRSRKQRNEVIQPFTKREILQGGGTTEILPYFRNEYFNNGSSSTTTFNRGSDNLDHIAGFSATTPDGLRYNYTIPVYNVVQEEVTFSVNGATAADQYARVTIPATGDNEPVPTDGELFLKKVNLPKYAHAYLLTSILGADYVDVTNDGVTKDDLGYWVKFTYDKKSNYKWREPFSKANFIEGWKTDPRDDKGSYTYGEKEIWHLRRAETKSHIAEFITSNDRVDAKGVTYKNQSDSDPLGASSFKLQNVVLYSRAAAASGYAIKTINFFYSNTLCAGTPNGGTGKLALTELRFEYGNAQHRGELNPYKFTYGNNFPYARNAYDRWGTYKPATDSKANIDFPYTDQNTDNKANIDGYAAAWSLSQIQTPSGSKIAVDYESDDYGYVQHKQAMQMEKIYDPIVAVGSAQAQTTPITLDQRKIRFKLQNKISGTLDHDGQVKIVKSYLGTSKQLYVKLFMKLLANNPNSYEYISGYVDIDPSTGEDDMGLEQVGGEYAFGFFKVGNSSGPHPFTKLVWQHLRTNQPDLLRGDGTLVQSGSEDKIVNQIRNLLPAFNDIRQMFSTFETYCDQEGFGKTIDQNRSWVRLNSVDKIKYGGGLRVKQITMNDNWSKDKDGIYGQVYDYSITEDSIKISSGVATYEPLIGGEENPLRYAKTFTESVPLRSDNNLYFEFPVNESYYPAPQIGYRKVTVMSLASAALAGIPLNNATTTEEGSPKSIFPKAGNNTWGTTGKTTHEFYTAKDFPVIADETDKDDRSFRMSIPVPFLGNVSISKLTSTQGYSIVTNDMHGKQKQLSTYRQLPSGLWESEPISWVKYNYMSEPKSYQKERVLALRNSFKLNTSDSTLRLPGDGETGDYTLGQENEFFIDMREHSDNTWEGGASGNLDIVYVPIFVPIPVPTIWPSIGKSNSRLRTAVTNKVIFRPGILESTEAYDGGSLVKTTNLKWDRLTGQVVLVSTTNDFDQPVYTYTIPAHTQYKGLGGAYQNVGLKLSIQSFSVESGSNNYSFPSYVTSALYPGDELVVYSNNVATARVIYMGDTGSNKQINNLTTSVDLSSGSNYTAIVVRSGFRNQLNASAGSITALADPTVPVAPTHYPKLIKAPANP